jgi:hypothetical protein
MEKPVLSPLFTMEDLRKLREYNSLRHIKMTTEELIADINVGADRAQKRIEQIREEKRKANDRHKSPL